MSEINDLIKTLDESALLEKKFQDVKIKKLEIDERKVNIELDKIHKDERDLALARSANFGKMSRDQIDVIIQNNEDYMEAAKNKMIFIDRVFDKIVPYFKKNLILIAGKTGDGKSTTVANIVRTTISQKNKETGKYRTALVITNEQLAEDFFNCITCQIKGWEYTDHGEFTPVQKEAFKTYINFLAGTGLVTVIDNEFNGSSGVTTTVEGLRAIFDSLIEKKQYYDVVIIDYYQNFKFSKLNPKLNQYEVQQQVCAVLDQYKNSYPAPIVLLAQIEPNKGKEETPYQFRIKGTKEITDKATAAIELIADRENLRSEWVIHKNRFQGRTVGDSCYTGYDKGQYVPYDEPFRKKVMVYKEKKQIELMNEVSGVAMKIKAEEKPKEKKE